MNFYSYAIFITIYVWAIFLVINIGGFYLCKRFYFDKFKNRKIFSAGTTSKQHKFEFINGIHSTFIFMLTGFFVFYLYKYNLTVIQEDFNHWGILYTLFSFFLLHTWHDTYFYWTHRAMHEWKFLKKYHVAHHHSKIPTPLAAASFSKVEAIIQGGFYISAVIFIPAHYSMYLMFYFFITYIAAIGHVEFEFWPNSLYRFPYGSTFNSITHHNLHHYYGKGNYGLYYRFWDEICGTLHGKTYEKFYKTQEQISKSKGIQNNYLRPHPNDILGLIFEEESLYGNNINIEIGEYSIKESSKELILMPQSYKIPHAYCDELSALDLYINNSDIFENTNTSANILVFQIDKVFKKSELFNKLDSIFSNQLSSRKWHYTYQKKNTKRRNSKASHFNHQQYTVIKVDESLSDEQKKRRYKEANSDSYRSTWNMFMTSHGIAFKGLFKILCYLDFKFIKRTGSIVDLGAIDSNINKDVYLSSPVTKQRPISITSFSKDNKTIITLKISDQIKKLDSFNIEQLVQDFHKNLEPKKYSASCTFATI